MKKQKKEPRKYVTYGIYYSPGKFKTPKTEPLNPPNKPRGGLWSSPSNSPLSWKRWCTMESFRESLLKFGTRFNISPTAKILILDNISDLVTLPPRYFSSDSPLFPVFQRKILNYEELLKDGYQGLHLTANGAYDLKWDYNLPPGYCDFYGWDCETMLIFDPSILRDIKYFGSRHSLSKKYKKAHS